MWIRPPKRFDSLSLIFGNTSLRASEKGNEEYASPFSFALAYISNSRIAMRKRVPERPFCAIPFATTLLKAFSYTRGTADRTVGPVSPALSTRRSTDSA